MAPGVRGRPMRSRSPKSKRKNLYVERLKSELGGSLGLSLHCSAAVPLRGSAIEDMKAIVVILTTFGVLAFTGCATNRGGVYDETDTSAGHVSGNPASPTFRPGMYPDDIRNPNELTRPIEPPPTTPP